MYHRPCLSSMSSWRRTKTSLRTSSFVYVAKRSFLVFSAVFVMVPPLVAPRRMVRTVRKQLRPSQRATKRWNGRAPCPNWFRCPHSCRFLMPPLADRHHVLHSLHQGRILEVSRGITCHDVREPLGVVASIVPFNFPVMVPLWTIPIALAAGNWYVSWKNLAWLFALVTPTSGCSALCGSV
jgi:Aldehyde dehydrogenase family